MDKREKVIKGLMVCFTRISCKGKGCPYESEYERSRLCQAHLRDDAIALLRAQEPRVMTFAEVKEHYNLPPVFVDDLDAQEDYYQDIQPLYFDFPNPTAWDVHWRNSDKVRSYLDEWEDRYNKTWRCWTSRPTDEQREKVKWE